MKYYQDDIDDLVAEFQRENAPTDRYASFDYCYHYFHPLTSTDLLDDIEKSCLTIGFYLASWGMLRGSSFLLSHSAKYYEPLIKYIAELDKSVWDIDVDDFSDENIKLICAIYKDIKDIIVNNGSSHLTLVTKTLLGVFGFVPAFDQYFGDTFRGIFKGECGFRSVDSKSLTCIRYFYEDNRDVIDRRSSTIFARDFLTGGDSNINYSKAKIIDMYGFSKGPK